LGYRVGAGTVWTIVTGGDHPALDPGDRGETIVRSLARQPDQIQPARHRTAVSRG
jgi:hypothetical protein